MRISWVGLAERVDHELRQLREEGHDVTDLVKRWESRKASQPSDTELRDSAEELYRKLEKDFPGNKDPLHEPSQWTDAVRLCQIKADEIPKHTRPFVENKILGGWLGRAAGCLLGKPVEKIPRRGIRQLLESNRTWPLNEYITERGIPPALLKEFPWNRHSGQESLRENIVCMTEDDDLNYPMINLAVLEKSGEYFTSEDVVHTWLEMLPILSTFTAERVAYLNAVSGLLPPRTAVLRNPYREWIGAQIRADIWGWVSPSQPSRAAAFAWRDARVSHVRNGIYGEAFFAAAIASSFEDSNVRSIVQKALAVVPSQSRFSQAVRYVIDLPIETLDWEDTVNLLYERYGSYHWVHTINNAALVVAALLSSQGSFERAICNVVMGGLDTDSNGATVGSILGTILGADRLPNKWIGPLHNRIRSSVRGFDNASFTDLARRTVEVARFERLHTTIESTA